MPVIKPHLDTPGFYFITFTNYQWLPLFQITDNYDVVYKWFEHLRTKNHYIVGYVIMPNHIHAIIAFNYGKISINTLVGNGKRFMAYEIVKRLESSTNTVILHRLQDGITRADKAKGQKHFVFQPSFDLKQCHDFGFVNQKLAYIHNNPIRKKWELASDATAYLHSSAKFYETGEQGIYSVTHYMDLIDSNWMKVVYLFAGIGFGALMPKGLLRKTLRGKKRWRLVGGGYCIK